MGFSGRAEMERSQPLSEVGLRPQPFLLQANPKTGSSRRRRRVVAVSAAALAIAAVALLVFVANGSFEVSHACACVLHGHVITATVAISCLIEKQQ